MTKSSLVRCYKKQVGSPSWLPALGQTIPIVTLLQRQDARHQPWFKHLDFIKVGEEAIKKLFWVPSTATSPGQAIERPGHCSDTPIEATVDHNAVSGGKRGSGHTTINHLGLSFLVPQWLQALITGSSRRPSCSFGQELLHCKTTEHQG